MVDVLFLVEAHSAGRADCLIGMIEAGTVDSRQSARLDTASKEA